MVRLKQRYILIEILQPPTATADSDIVEGFTESPSRALLGIHRQSPKEINPKSITHTIRQTIQELYGDFGASFSTQLNIKYFNNKTSCGIIRCGVQNFQYVLGAITLINNISGTPVIIQCSHVSGTIKKCEQFAAHHNRQLMRTVEVYQRLEAGKSNTI